jgi:hypothetical protein
MKVWIGPYTKWVGPYQLAEKLMFWVPQEKDEYGFSHTADRVHKFGEWLAHGSVEPEPKVGEALVDNRPLTLLAKFLNWIYSKQKRTIIVKIDKWDTWSMDHTLAHIILPMLKQLQETKHGSQIVDFEDVPENLRTTNSPEYSDQQCFEFYREDEDDKDLHARWEWVVGEMIWAFEQHIDENAENQFHTGKHDQRWVKCEDGNYQMVKGENDTYKFDIEAFNKWADRKANGFRLFGKYYQGLWD